MSIFPLPVFDADSDPHHRDALTDAEQYERLEPPKTIVVRLGYLKNVAEYRYEGDAKPGCGSKLVVRSHRGTEVVEMLTTTCDNAGCAKSVTRKEMLQYIEHSGGKDYPFYTKGRVLRVATVEDLNKQSALHNEKPLYVKTCKRLIKEHNLSMKLVEAEPILGGELLTFYYMAERRVDFRELVKELAAEFKTRIEMRQVGARDEARLVADYERCGQHCCCKSFLKVLKPVSMKSAKVQKATLDPLKISGRCGRLMCCLRYEDQTYKELKANLPRKSTRVGTEEGPGVVIDSKILVQMVLVRLDEGHGEVAVPVEELMDPDECPRPGEKKRERERKAEAEALRGMPAEKVIERVRSDAEEEDSAKRKGRRRRRRRRGKGQQQDAFRARSEQIEGAAEARQSGTAAGGAAAEQTPAGGETPGGGTGEGGAKPRRRRRRRRRGKGRGEGATSSGSTGS
ncbi:MAG: PSP1 domain-containing protein [Planctomycetota bacterium]|jgi:cell fate regulator YaaT (PSP1 superfamily)